MSTLLVDFKGVTNIFFVNVCMAKKKIPYFFRPVEKNPEQSLFVDVEIGIKQKIKPFFRILVTKIPLGIPWGLKTLWYADLPSCSVIQRSCQKKHNK